jgi:hypothetical protein
MSDLRQFCELKIENNAVKCVWMFDVEYVTFLGRLRSFGQIDKDLVKQIAAEFENFNYEYPFVDFQLPFLTEKVNVPNYQEKVGYWYNYSIQHAQTHSNCKCQICQKSFEGVTEKTLVLQQYSGKKGARGNETEGYYQFCFDCSKTHLAWLLHKNEKSSNEDTDRFIETTLLKDFFSNCDKPSGFDNLVQWIKKDILDTNEEVNGGTIATHYRYFVEKALQNL